MSKRNNYNGCRAIMYAINRKGVTITDCARVMGLTRQTLHRHIKNPFNLNLQQLYTLSGYLGLPFLELMFLIDNDKEKTSETDRKILAELPSNFDEYSALKPEHLK